MVKSLLTGKMAAVATGFALANVASATTVSYNFTGETGGGVDMGIHVASGTVDAEVGQFIMTTSTPGFSSTLLTYCTDVGVDLSHSFNYTPTALSAATGVSPAWVSGGIQNAATLWFDDKGSATTATQTAGLQLAIWELLYNAPVGSYSLATLESHSNGGFYVTTTDSNSTAAMNAAIADLNTFASLTPEVNQVIWLAPTEANGTTGGSQGLLYPGTTTNNVPNAPDSASTLGMLGLAVLALGVASRKLSAANA
jgi:hypothetical protein